MKFEVHLNGKDAIDSVHGFKGALQSAIRHSRKYPNARLTANKQRRTIKVQNVDREFIEENLRKIQSTKVAFKGVGFDIDEIHEREKEPKPDESTEKKYRHWMETTQKEFQKKERRTRQLIERLEEEIKKLTREKETLANLRREDERKYSDLQKSYEAVSKMVDELAEGKVRDPSKACSDWVGDWMVTAQKIENRIEESVGDVEPHELVDLLSMSEESILKEASRKLGLESANVEDISSLAGGIRWEETEHHKKNIDSYNKALEEMEFLEDVNSGKIKAPPTVVDILMKEIDEGRNQNIITKFETEREKFKVRTEKAETASYYLEEMARVEKVKELVLEFRELKSLPIAVVCNPKGRKWSCEVLFPYGEEEGFLEKILDDIAFNTLRKHCQKMPGRERSESMCAIKAPVPGKYKSWKDVSRFQEKVQGTIVDRLKGSVIGGLRVPWTVSKVMSQRNG
ncbi:MAG: hypothetical protein E3J35_09475 [Methanomassiliicoccales archaeon]|nr:MAG: hypothetical protein E3J35_09475 [Methanomassiliicoccales archaeon]